MKIQFTGSIGDYSGYGEATRQSIMALHSQKVEMTVQERSFVAERGADFGEAGALCQRLLNKKVDYEAKIIETTPNFFHDYLEPYKLHIGFFFWEVIGMPRDWVWECNRMDKIFITSKLHARQLREYGVRTPVYAIPQAMDVEAPKGLEKLRIKGFNGTLFYSIFQWTERKNPKGLLMTFWKTFEGRKDVGLLIKTYKGGFSEGEKLSIISDVKKWKEESGIKKIPPTFLALEMMSSEEIARLHETGDIYVSAHRGEGWGVPQSEAMVHGKPIISTSFGGIHDWLSDKEAWLIPFKYTAVKGMEWIHWYNNDQMWADPNYKILGDAMMEAYKNPNLVKSKGIASRKFAKENFNYKSVGLQMINALKDR